VAQVASHIIWNGVSSTHTYGYRQVTTAKLLNPAGQALAGKVLRLCTTAPARTAVCVRVTTNAAGSVVWYYTPAGTVSAGVYFDGDAATLASATHTVTWVVTPVVSHIVWNGVSSTHTYGYRQVTTARLLNPAGKPLAGKVLRLCTTNTARVSVCAKVRTNAAGSVVWYYTPTGHVSAAVYFDGDATTRASATRTVTWRVTPTVSLTVSGRTIKVVTKPAHGATIYLFAWNGRSWILKARQAPRTGVAYFTGVRGVAYTVTVGATASANAAYAPNYVRAR